MESITGEVAGVLGATVITDSLDPASDSSGEGGKITENPPENLIEAEIKNELYSP